MFVVGSLFRPVRALLSSVLSSKRQRRFIARIPFDLYIISPIFLVIPALLALLAALGAPLSAPPNLYPPIFTCRVCILNRGATSKQIRILVLQSLWEYRGVALFSIVHLRAHAVQEAQAGPKELLSKATKPNMISALTDLDLCLAMIL